MSVTRIEPAPLRSGIPPISQHRPGTASGTTWETARQWLERPRSARQMVLWLALYLGLVANWPLWNELARIGGAPSTYLPTIAAMSLLSFCGTVAMLSFTAWTRWMKPLWLAVAVLAALVQHLSLIHI